MHRSLLYHNGFIALLAVNSILKKSFHFKQVANATKTQSLKGLKGNEKILVTRNEEKYNKIEDGY